MFSGLLKGNIGKKRVKREKSIWMKNFVFGFFFDSLTAYSLFRATKNHLYRIEKSGMGFIY